MYRALVGVLFTLGSLAWGVPGALAAEIVFYRDGQVWLANDDGTNQRAVYTSPEPQPWEFGDGAPKLTPDGQSVVLQSDVGSVLVDLRTGSRTTVAPGGQGGDVTIDPDNTAIYASQMAGSLGPNIGRFPLDGSPSTRVTNGPGPDWNLSISADGSRAVFKEDHVPDWSDPYSNIARIWRIENFRDGGTPQLTTLDGTIYPDYSRDVALSPDGTKIAYIATKAPSTRPDLFVANFDGTAARRVMTTSTREEYHISWSPDSSRILYGSYRQGTPDQLRSIRPDGTGDRLVMTGIGRATYQSAGRGRPWKFRPSLRFDQFERYFPQDVDRFFAETDSAGSLVHRLCSPEGCTPLADVTDLGHDEANWIDVGNDEEGEGAPQSPNPACTEDGKRDCEFGTSSAIYFWETDTGGRTFVDYWFFYRFNDYPLGSPGDHEGDWESVTIAQSDANPDTFDFASFSQHGYWYSYLRQNLSCDDGAPGSCGNSSSRTGRRVSVFVADGSHANYPIACGALQENCGDHRNPPHEWLGEGLHGGENPWDNDSAHNALIPLKPPGGANTWTAWPGKWGAPWDGTPRSPAVGGNGVHFNAPWSSECARDNDNCASAAAARRARARVYAACDGWFGGGVTAAACSPPRLRAAIAGGKRFTRGSYGFVAKKRRRGPVIAAASASGVAQALGRGLKPGERLVLRGPTPRGTVLLVRAARGRRAVEARFADVRLGKRRDAVVTAVRKGRGVTVVMRLRSGKRIQPDRVRHVPGP